MSSTTDYASFGDDVLFVGHSLVGFLPDMLADIVSDGGGTGTFSAQIQNGAPLRWNWQESQRATVDALVVLPEGETDVLILTEAIPLDPNLKFNKTELYAADFYNLAIDSNPDTKVYMYETWHSIWSGTDRADDIPYKSGAGDLIPWRERLELDLEKWEGVVDSVNSQRGAGEPEMLLIPAGQALGRLSDAIDAGQVPGLTSIEELFSDDIHLNELGQYFVAMVQYATIYGEDPSGIDAQLQGRFGTDFDAPSEALAAAFQEIAWEAVTEYTGSAGSGGGTDPVPTPDPNTAPDAIFDKVTIDQDQTVQIAVLDNDVDVDGDALTVTAVGTPGHGTAEIQGGEIRYTPAAGFAGTDSFSYTVSDGQGGTDTAWITVTVNQTHSDPDAIFDKVTIDQDQTVQIAVLDNDTASAGTELTVTAVGTPGHGTAEIQGGEIRYTPADGFAGTDSFSYTVSDGQGGTDTAWVTVTVNAVEGGLTLYGDGRSNVLLGQDGNDALYGDGGSDYLQGGGGADSLFGGNDDDVLEGGAGANVLYGGAGEDYVSFLGADNAVTLNLNNSADNSTQDVLVSIENVLGSLAHSNTLTGDSGKNVLIGGNAADVVRGLDGDDILIGQDGDDVLVGGRGADLLIGGTGNDAQSGGAGADRFLFDSDGRNTITDFSIEDGDQVIFVTGLVNAFEDLGLSANTQGDLVIDYGTNASVTLRGLTLDDLESGGGAPSWLFVL